MTVWEERLHNSVFMKACRGESVPHAPVWLMRQAGRYMQEYRDLRARVSFLELCKSPDLACEVTVHARNRIGADAAILFADILLIVEALGLPLAFNKGEGPSIERPVREATDVDGLRSFDPDELEYVYTAVSRIRAALPGNIPLIGFAGAPFTVASYMIEGGSSREYLNTKRMMFGDRGLWHALMTRLADSTAAYLLRQVEAGAQAIQLFDSWVGCLSAADYREYVLPYSRRVLSALEGKAPRIHFGRGTGMLLEVMREAGAEVVGIDYMTDLAAARRRLGDTTVQGNLDPAILLTNPDIIRAHVERILKEAGPRGHIFNLGHGIVPQTPVEHVICLIEMVHELSQA